MAPPRPRWEANKKQAPAKTQKAPKLKAVVTNQAPAQTIPLELQQLLLNIFKDSFAERFEQDIKPLLQEVKGHLYNRDFVTAFGKDEYLETYAARWSASRALGYADLFWDLREHLWTKNVELEDGGVESSLKKTGKIICLGGGAGAEVVALAGVQKMFSREHAEEGAVTLPRMDIEAIDVADWKVVVGQLSKHITEAPPLSKYASASVKATNAALIDPESINVSFQKHDVLKMDQTALSDTLDNATVVALLFTLNELYSTSVALTQKFLLNLTAGLSTGAMLLVVDSPGSYSTVMLNGTEKKYPMQWLLDHTLLNEGGSSAKDKDVKWEKIHEDQSRWFRLDANLRYPIELENMRMQLHLYRRL